ncbi:MAG: hypothetical protein IJF12_04565 [Alphaproteobacteria bacterium]|nr:hypothetical protein [Alphaproteobacteria bacterium]
MSQNQEDKKIPDFLQELPVQEINQTQQNLPHKSSFLQKTFLIVSACWFAFILLYIHFLLGWDSLSVILPSEFIKFLALSIIVLLLILLLISMVFKSYTFASQATLLNKVLFSEDKNVFEQMINQALREQIDNLTKTASNISMQNEILKNELTTKAQDFENINSSLEKCFSQNMTTLSDNIKNMLSEYKTAAQTAQDFSTKADELKNSAVNLSSQLNPLINETVSTADYLKNIISESKGFIENHLTDMQNFATTNQEYLQKMMLSFDEKTSKLEKTFLQTADNCEEIYKRLDSSISHIENSLKTHKQMAQEQSALIDKNSNYLDNKLGEYGKLISMEVEAMIERSSTLDTNVDNQVKCLSVAGQKIARILDDANNSLEEKSVNAMQTIEKTINKLENELSKLNEFIAKTENKNDEIKSAAEKITEKIGDLSLDLGLKVDDLKIRAVEAIDKFNEVNAVVKTNTMQLFESADIIVNKGKEGSKSLENQYASIVSALAKFDDIKTKISQIEQGIISTSDNAGNSFKQYQEQIKSLKTAINEQIEELDNHKIRSERHLTELKQQYNSFSMANFMNESSELVTRLENLSVDINKYFNSDEEDDLWKKFYSGDHAVFARNIVKKLNRKQIVKIRDEYEKNADFRVLTDKYISDFETLITAAQNAEKSEVILAMISGADIGKIYYVIARAIDRLK